jgi:CubicO group peptidase (beta-lactamase class C family)
MTSFTAESVLPESKRSFKHRDVFLRERRQPVESSHLTPKFLFLVNILIRLWSVNEVARATTGRATIERVESTIRQALAGGTMPGATLAIGEGSTDAFYMGAFGWAAVHPHRRPMVGSTLFDIASLTKVLATVLLVMKHTERGQLDIDTPLGEILPSYYPPDKSRLTIRQLLTHTAGLPAEVRLREQLAPEPQGSRLDKTRDSVMKRMLASAPEYEPGTDVRYSDQGPILVGDLLEKLSGESLDRLCERELYSVSGLADTFFVHLDHPLPKARRPPESFAATEDCPWRERVVVGQVHDENAYLLRGVAGHAGLFSNAEDLSVLARMLLNPDTAGGYLRADTVRHFTQSQLNLPGARAVGWMKPVEGGPFGDFSSPAAFGHTGFTGTSIWIDPDKDLYVILLTNRVHPSRQNTELLRFRPQLHNTIVKALGKA